MEQEAASISYGVKRIFEDNRQEFEDGSFYRHPAGTEGRLPVRQHAAKIRLARGSRSSASTAI